MSRWRLHDLRWIEAAVGAPSHGKWAVTADAVMPPLWRSNGLCNDHVSNPIASDLWWCEVFNLTSRKVSVRSDWLSAATLCTVLLAPMECYLPFRSFHRSQTVAANSDQTSPHIGAPLVIVSALFMISTIPEPNDPWLSSTLPITQWAADQKSLLKVHLKQRWSSVSSTSLQSTHWSGAWPPHCLIVRNECNLCHHSFHRVSHILGTLVA